MHQRLPDGVVSKAFADLKAYKAKEGLSDYALGKRLGISMTTIQKWLKGKGRPFTSNLIKLMDLGVTDVKLPDEARTRALQQIMQKADNKNKVPRSVRKMIAIPDVVNNQIKLLLDEYVRGLREARTWEEHEVGRAIVIQKLYHITKQGE